MSSYASYWTGWVLNVPMLTSHLAWGLTWLLIMMIDPWETGELKNTMATMRPTYYPWPPTHSLILYWRILRTSWFLPAQEGEQTQSSLNPSSATLACLQIVSKEDINRSYVTALCWFLCSPKTCGMTWFFFKVRLGLQVADSKAVRNHLNV